MITLVQNNKIFNIDIIAFQEPWKNTRNQIKYYSQKNSFYLLYLKCNKIKVCFFINKKIDQSTWTHITNRTRVISLYLNLLNRFIYIYNLYNEVNANKISTNILILEQKLSKYPNKEYLALGNFNFHHKIWKKIGALRALIEKFEELIIITQR